MVQRIPSFMHRRPSLATLTVVAIMAVAVGGSFFRLLQHPTDVLTGVHRGGNNDLTAVFIAVRSFPAISWLERGQTPRWNPFQHFGSPFTGNPQSGVFYPPNWVFFAIDAAAGVSWLLVLHHVWGGLGVFFLCRRYGVSGLAATTGFIVFLAAPFLIAQTAEGHYNQICVVAWVPWAFLAYEGLRAGKPGGAIMVAIMLAMGFFAGHVQEVFYLTLILTVCLLADAGRAVFLKQPAEARRLALGWLAVGAATIGLVAVELLQVWVYTKYAVRSKGFTVQMSGAGLTPGHLQQLWNPWALGGPANYRLPYGFFWETLCYFGVLPLALALLGGIVGWRKFPARRYSLIGILSLVFAFGAATPFFSLLFHVVPGISFFRMPSRALYFCSFAVAVLAAFGIEVIGQWLGSRSRKAQFAMAVGGLACIVELSFFSNQILRTIPVAGLRRDSSLTSQLQADAGLSRIIAVQELLSDREAWSHGLFKLQAYEPVPLTASVAAMDAAVLRDADLLNFTLGFQDINLATLDKPMLDLLGVRYAAVGKQAGDAIPGWRKIGDGQMPAQVAIRGSTPDNLHYQLYENERPLPRAFVVGKVRQLGAQEDPVKVLASIDPHTTVLLERDYLPGRRRSEYRPAKIVEYAPNNVIVEVDLDDPGYLILTDTLYPGWSVTDNGQQARLLRANVGFRAVALTAGQHRVEFSFSPPTYAVGVLVSLITVALSAGLSLRRLEAATATAE